MVQKKNLVGNQFGHLTVIKEADESNKISKYTGTTWECLCECGKVCYSRGDKLRSGIKRSCGCKQYSLSAMKHSINNKQSALSRIGTKTNFLTITGLSDKTFNNGHGFIYKCTCDCGNTLEVRSSNLKSQLSCGKCQFSNRNKDDLSGNQYEYYKVITLSNIKLRDKFTWECLCECGTTFYSSTQFILENKKSSCGCKTKYVKSISAGGTGIPYEHSDFYDMLRAQPYYFTWQKAVLKKYNKCSGLTTEKHNLETHHIIPLNIVIKRYGITKQNYLDHLPAIYDINNGIPIEQSLHKQFHNIYGTDTTMWDLFEFNNYLEGLS